MKEKQAKELVTLEDCYKRKNELYDLALRDLLEGLRDDEILLVKNGFKSDGDLICFPDCLKNKCAFDYAFNRVFKSPQKMFESMKKHCEFIEEEEQLESLKDIMWWSVRRQKLENGEYRTNIWYIFSTDGKLLNYATNHPFYNHYRPEDISENERKLLEWGNVFGEGYSLIRSQPPYQVGDILLLDKKFCVVYGGESKQQENRWHSFNCLYFNQKLQGVYMGDLEFYCFKYHPHIDEKESLIGWWIADYQKVESCPNELLMKASKKLKENPGLWDEWLDIYEKNRLSESEKPGGLEKFVFDD